MCRVFEINIMVKNGKIQKLLWLIIQVKAIEKTPSKNLKKLLYNFKNIGITNFQLGEIDLFTEKRIVVYFYIFPLK